MPFVIASPTGDTFLTLLTEFYNRGFDYMNDSGTQTARAKRFINQAINELCEMAPWPFLRVTSTDPAPLALTDVRHVLSVVDTTTDYELEGITREALLATVTRDLTTTGTAVWWWLDGTTLNVYPVSTNTLSVRYIQVPADLSADADVCVVPKRYSQLVVDLAVRRGYENKDAFDASNALRAGIDERIGLMRATLLGRGESEYVLVTNGYDG